MSETKPLEINGASTSVIYYCDKMQYVLFLSDLQALGMENNHIPDARITATSAKPGYEASKGRLNGNSCWMPDKNKNTEHLKVEFVTKVTIVAIATQGSPIDDCWVESYTYQWFDGSQLNNGLKVKKMLVISNLFVLSSSFRFSL